MNEDMVQDANNNQDNCIRNDIRGALVSRKRRRRRLRNFFVFFIIFLLTAMVMLLLGVKHYTAPPDPGYTGEGSIVSIPAGSSASQIATILEREGMVRNALVFQAYMMYKGEESALVAGKYLLNPAMSFDMIIQKLKAGEVYRETVWFVIPEGYNVEQIAATLDEEGIVEKEDFLRLADNPPINILQEFPFLTEVPGNVKYHLEGYLFPARYEVNKNAAPQDIIKIMLQAFQKRMLTDERLNKMAEKEITLHEAITLAAIIEREAVVEKERKIISSVFHNRLRIGMKLQSCATVQYVLGEVREVLLYQDLRIESAYNTYLHPGLPPGPIASPGEASFRATFFPAETDYLFFVLKSDGSGEHFFGRTLHEHNQNRARAR